jgi:hypothetical protein
MQVNNTFLSSLSDKDLMAMHNMFVAELNARKAAGFKAAKGKFLIGDMVKFPSSKLNKDITGTVTKICPKYISVSCGVNGNWRVPAPKLNLV